MSVVCVCSVSGGTEGKHVDFVCHTDGTSCCVPFLHHVLSTKDVAMCPKTTTEMRHRANGLSSTSSDALNFAASSNLSLGSFPN